MKYEVMNELPGRRCIIKGEYKDLPIDGLVVVYKGGREWNGVVETRCGYGAVVVRVVSER